MSIGAKNRPSVKMWPFYHIKLRHFTLEGLSREQNVPRNLKSPAAAKISDEIRHDSEDA